MDFSRILDDWENQQKGRDKESYSRDEAPQSPTPLRSEMEQAAIDDELDLHGMLQQEALDALRLFLAQSQREGLKKVLVIHGKGLHSENHKSVLREAVQQVLMKDRNVASWGEAGKKHGGRGASWVWLSARGR